MIPGDLLSAFPHRQFYTLPGLLDSWAALPNSNPNACVPMQGGSLHHFYDGLWYDPAERRTHDLPCERTRYRLSQPDTVLSKEQNSRRLIPPSSNGLYKVECFILVVLESQRNSLTIESNYFHNFSSGLGITENKYENEAPPKFLIITFFSI